jgi:hypothetical protein
MFPPNYYFGLLFALLDFLKALGHLVNYPN